MTRHRHRASFALAVLAAAAPLVSCSSPTGIGSQAANDLTCAPGELVLEGTVGGALVSLREPSSEQAFVNKLSRDDPGTLSAKTPSVQFALAFDVLLSSAQVTAARGSVKATGADGAPVDVGNCDAGPSDSILSYTGTGDASIYRFTLRKVRRSPYCAGDALEGELRGCLSTKPSR